MKKLLVAVVGLAAFLTGCAHGGTPVPIGSPVRVTITPTSAMIHAGTVLQFTAMVTNTSNTAVTWQVNGTTGGNPTVGTISTSGLYTAPSAVPTSASITVAAVSQVDPTASASAAVTIEAPSNFSVSPSSATVLAGATLQFSVTVVGTTPVPAVNWQVNGVTGGNATVGTISPDGLYTAPGDPPSGQRVAVTAVSQADASQTASAPVTVLPSLATLNGRYTFSFNGHDSQGFVAAAGSFVADGKGNVTEGIEDINRAASVVSDLHEAFSGTYTVDRDGRGTLVLFGSILGTQTFQLVVLSSARARLLRFDTSVTASGTLDLQDPNAFTVSALNGNYVVNLDGVDLSSAPLSAIARISLNGAASVSSTTSFMDENDNGNVHLNQQASGGRFGVASDTGRGTLTLSAGALGTFNFVIYVISAQKFRLVSLDLAPARWSGSANIQQGSTFTNTSFKGNMVFIAGGNTPCLDPPACTSGGTAVDDAGQFFSSGGGGITNGIGDENNNGSTGLITKGYQFSGNYSVSDNPAPGRGTMTLASTDPRIPSVTYVFYLESTSEGVLLRADSGAVTSGLVNAQTQSQFVIPDVIGPYVFTVGGVSLSSRGPLATSGGDPLDKMGQFTADGSGGATGTEDINDGGTLNGNLALTATYTTAVNGRGTLNITAGGSTRVLNFYLVSPKEMFLIGLDNDQVLAGRADKQFP